MGPHNGAEPKAPHWRPWARWLVPFLMVATAGLGCGDQASQRSVVQEAVERGRLNLGGPSPVVNRVAFTADGTLVASGTNGTYDAQTKTHGGGVVRLWDVASGQERACLTGHSGAITALAFTTDGRTLASGTAEFDRRPGEIKLWDVALARQGVTLRGHSGAIHCLAFTADGSLLASGSSELKLWDLAAGRERATLDRPTGAVVQVAFAPDGKTLVSAAGGGRQTPGELKLWDVATGKQRATLTGHTGPVQCLAITPDGQTLATGGEGPLLPEKDRPRYQYPTGEIKLWDLATGKQLVPVKGHPEPLRWGLAFLAFTADGRTLVSVTANEVKLWDVASGRERVTVKGEMYSSWSSAVCTPQGITLVSRNQHLLKLWDLPGER